MTNTKPSKTASYNVPYVYFICLVASLGGVMFGFDLGIITGVVPYIEHQFNLSGFNLGLVVAIFELGCMAGALYTGRVATKYGGRRTMIFVAALFIITAVGAAYAPGATTLAIWRFAQGVCVGAASVLAPMYVAEVTPAKVRGRMVSIYQLTIILGIVLASLSNYYFGENDPASNRWRLMILSAVVPGTIYFILLFLIPESPRWLIIQSSKEEEAGDIFLKINKGNEERSRNLIQEVKNSVNHANSGSGVAFRTMFKKAFLPIVLIGVGIAFLQQFCGINNVTPYMQKIFLMAGLQLKDGLLNAVFVQLVFLFSTFIAIAIIEKTGRKLLMLVGTGLMAITLFILSLAFNVENQSGIIILILVMVYIGTFGFTLGPVVWVLISEMYPAEIRGRAIAFTAASLWVATFIVVLVSPYLLEIGPVFNFVTFGILNVVGFIFCLRYLPETKGKTLEQMKEVWQKKLKRT